MAPVTLLKTGNASLEASWMRLACAGDKRARACTSKRRGESALPRIRRGFWIEADPRHVKEVIKALGLEGASPVPAPGVAAKEETGRRERGQRRPRLGARGDHHVPRGRGEASQYRPDIAFATMKLCSKMSRLDAQDLKNMKSVGRFTSWVSV